MFGQFNIDHMLTDGAWKELTIILFSGWLFVANVSPTAAAGVVMLLCLWQM
jgi:hypothetical protein